MADISFDDLVPQGDATTAPEVSFDDLTPSTEPSAEVSFDDLVPATPKGYLERVGERETASLENTVKEIKAPFQEPFKKDASPGPSWLQKIGYFVGKPAAALMGAAAAPAINTVTEAVPDKAADTLTGLAFDANFPDADPAQRAEVVEKLRPTSAETIGGAVGGAALLAAGGAEVPDFLPAKGAAKVADELPTTPHAAVRDHADLFQGQQEALAQVAIGARNPTTLTAEQTAAALEQVRPKRPLAEINADINEMAANTAGLGVKERLSLLQKEKEDLLNPQSAIDRRINDLKEPAAPATTTKKLTPDAESYLQSVDMDGMPAYLTNNVRRIAKENGIEITKDTTPEMLVAALKEKQTQAAPAKPTTSYSKLTDDQFQTNIAYPVYNAIDAGVPLARIRTELEANLATSIRDEVYRKELVDRAIPQAFKDSADTAKTAGLATGTNQEAVEGIVNPILKTPDDGSVIPSLAPQGAKIKTLGKDAIESILNSKLAKGRSQWVDDMNMLDLMDRASAKLNNKSIGRRDMAEMGDLTTPRNLSQRGAEMTHSLIGDAAGTNDFVLTSKGKSSILEKNTNVLPLNTSIKRAKIGGMKDGEIEEFLKARDAYDDYANLDRNIKEVTAQLDDNQRMLAMLQHSDMQGMSFLQKRGIGSKITELKKDVIENKAFLKDIAKKQSHMTKEQVQTTLAKYENNPIAQDFGKNINTLHSHLLDILQDAGKLSAEEAANLRKSHPNYLPAWRDVDDFSFGSVRYQNTGDSPKPFRAREISKKELGDVYENMVLNVIQTTRKVEQAKFRSTLLQDFLLPKMDDAAFNTIFRERKVDVEKAINDLKMGKRQRISADQVTPTDPNKVQTVGNITFDIDGKRLQLTIKDYELFKEISKSRIYDEIPPFARAIIAASRIRRNLITSWNLGFSTRAFQRDSMDFIAGAKATPFKDYIPVASNFKYLFTKEFNPELYNTLANNLGFGSTVARDFYGKSAEQVVSIGKAGLEGKTSLNPLKPVLHGLENVANRVDIAPRILQYKITLKNLTKQGMSEAQAKEAAMRTARELGVNYAQKGTNSSLDTYVKTVTFARTFINSTDRLIRYARYEPAKLARNTFLGLYLPYAALMHYNRQFTGPDGVPYVDKLDPNLKKDMLPIYYPGSESENDYIPWRLGWVFGRSLPAIDKSVGYAQQEIGGLIDRAMQEEADRIVNSKGDIKAMGISGKDVYSAWLDYSFGLVQPSSMLPVGVSDATAIKTNTNAFGNDIVPPDLVGKMPFEQTRPGQTSQMLTDFSYSLQQRTGKSFSPIQAEYLLNSLFSSAGGISLTAGNLIYAAGTGREVPQIENREIPFFNTFSGKGTEVSKDGTSSEFYNIDKYLQDIGAEHDALENNVKENPAHAPDLVKFREDNAVELYYLDKYKGALGTIKDYRDTIAQIAGADKNTLQGNQTPEHEALGDPVKREKINELKQKITQVQKSILDDIEQSNLDTDEIWHERETHSAPTKAIEGVIDFLKPNKKAPKGAEESSFLDHFSPISDANAAEIKVPEGKLKAPVTAFKESKDGPALQKASVKYRIPTGEMMALANIESTINTKTDKGYLQMTKVAEKQARQYIGEKGKDIKRDTSEGYAELATAYAAWTRDQVKSELKLGGMPALFQWYPAYNIGVQGWKTLKDAPKSKLSTDVLTPDLTDNNAYFYYKNGKVGGEPLTVAESLAKYKEFVERKYNEYAPEPAQSPFKKEIKLVEKSSNLPSFVPTKRRVEKLF